jgi:hypothetical protein
MESEAFQSEENARVQGNECELIAWHQTVQSHCHIQSKVGAESMQRNREQHIQSCASSHGKEPTE